MSGGCAVSSRRGRSVWIEGLVLYAPGCRTPWQRAMLESSKAPRITSDLLREASKLRTKRNGGKSRWPVVGRKCNATAVSINAQAKRGTVRDARVSIERAELMMR